MDRTVPLATTEAVWRKMTGMDAMLTPGAQVGNYIVEELITVGGMAELYRVRHAMLGTVHALKALDPSLRARAEVRARFLSEGVIAAKIHHPNIARVTDTVSTPEVAGLIMEFVPGDLERYIHGLRSAPSAAEIRVLFMPVLSALATAHRHGIIHRDIKPANILLADTPEGMVPKVTDFGVAKVTAAGISPRKVSTLAESRMGTLSYMSPEQVRGAKDVTVRSDIFSLGATLYELATRTVAFGGDSEYEVMHRIVEGRYTPLEDLPGIDPAIAAAIRKALHPDPQKRFASCEEFAAALAAAQPVDPGGKSKGPGTQVQTRDSDIIDNKPITGTHNKIGQFLLGPSGMLLALCFFMPLSNNCNPYKLGLDLGPIFWEPYIFGLFVTVVAGYLSVRGHLPKMLICGYWLFSSLLALIPGYYMLRSFESGSAKAWLGNMVTIGWLFIAGLLVKSLFPKYRKYKHGSWWIARITWISGVLCTLYFTYLSITLSAHIRYGLWLSLLASIGLVISGLLF